jgi:hypothetical protein
LPLGAQTRASRPDKKKFDPIILLLLKVCDLFFQ